MTDYEKLYNAAMETISAKNGDTKRLENKIAELDKLILRIRADNSNLKVTNTFMGQRITLLDKSKDSTMNDTDTIRMRTEHVRKVDKLQTGNTLLRQRCDLAESGTKALRSKLDKANADLALERGRLIQPALKQSHDSLTVSDAGKRLAKLQREVAALQSRLSEQTRAIKRSNFNTQTLQAKLNESGEALQNMVNEKYPDQLREKDVTIKSLRDNIGTLEIEAKKDGIEIGKLRQKIKTKGAKS